MNRKDLQLFLILEVIAVIWAGLVFQIFDSRLLAGAMAGTYFVLSGLYMVLKAWQWPSKWQSLTLYPLLVHVFVISIPMVAVRFYQYQSAFGEVNIWGIPGPIFHRLSSTIFFVLIGATLIDWWRVRKSRTQ